jgi:parallel beta-helix repeat protein
MHGEHLPTPRQLLAPVALLLIGCCLAFGAGPALANHVSCGDRITADTTLDTDLVNCPNHGIVIGADDITVDLNGHLIDGDGAPFAQCRPRREACDIGVLNDGHDGVTVMHGSVRQFGLGVLVGGAGRTRLLDLSVARNMFSGVVIAESARTELRRSVVAVNGLDTDQAGISVFQSGHSRIVRTAIRRNGDIGVYAEGANDSIFARNKLSGNPEAAMLIGGNRNVFDRNRVVRNGEGITVGGNRNTITRNRVADSRAGTEGGGLGIFAAAGHDNVVAGNFVARASRVGIQVSLLPEELEGDPPAVNTVVRGNRLRGNGDGVYVQTTARRTVLKRNDVRRSKDDGIDVDSPSTTLIGNQAVRNADLGIEAVFGVIDGGGNIARHNGDPRQCTNIFCS